MGSVGAAVDVALGVGALTLGGGREVLGLRRRVPRRIGGRPERAGGVVADAHASKNARRGRGSLTDDPLALDAETMRQLGYRAVDMLVDAADRPVDSAAAPRDTRRDGRAAERPAAGRAAGLRRDPAPPRRGRAALHEQGRPSRLLRLRPVLGHLAGRARRPDRERRNVYAGSWMESAGPEPARARGGRLVQGLGRLPGRGRGHPRQRRLGGEPDRARLRAGGAGRAHVRRPRRLRLRPGPLRPSPARPATSASARARCA